MEDAEECSAPAKREGRAARRSSLAGSKAGLWQMQAKIWIQGLKEAGHSQTELVFSLLFDELGIPLVRLRPPTAQGCTLFSQTAGRGSGLLLR